MGCSDSMGIGQGVVRHMTQWALLVWSVTQVWVPGQTTLEHDSVKVMKNVKPLIKHVMYYFYTEKLRRWTCTSCLLLHSPWYMTSRSGCPMQRAISITHSSLYDFPSLPHTACFREMWEQSGEHTHWGLPVFILQTFPGLHLTPSQVSTKAQRVVSYVHEHCTVSV